MSGANTISNLILSNRCRSPARSGIASPRRFATYKAPLPPSPTTLNCILPSTLFCHRSLPSPLIGRAAQPPEFGPRDVVGLTWSSPAILPPSRLAALIRPFLEPKFPRRWSDSDVGIDARPNLPGRSLPNPTPVLSPPLSFSFCFFERPSERSASLPSLADVENALPSRLLAALLTTPFLVDFHASSSEAWT
jgi:hypothetical protein